MGNRFIPVSMIGLSLSGTRNNERLITKMGGTKKHEQKNKGNGENGYWNNFDRSGLLAVIRFGILPKWEVNTMAKSNPIEGRPDLIQMLATWTAVASSSAFVLPKEKMEIEGVVKKLIEKLERGMGRYIIK